MHRPTWRRLRAALALLAAWGALAGCGGGGGGGPPVTPSSDATLSDLAVSAGALAPAFLPGVTTYGVGPALLPASTRVTATATDAGATVRVNATVTPSGTPSSDIPLAAGLTPVTVEVTAADGTTRITYTVIFERALSGQEAYVKASDAEAEDVFGASVAISGDTLVVGAPGAASGEGAAYVFMRTESGWTQQAILRASNAGVGDRFGTSVAIATAGGSGGPGGGGRPGDVSAAPFTAAIVVGAPAEDSRASGPILGGDARDDSLADSGAAYVFVRGGNSWSQEAYLKASNPGSGDGFGTSVAVSGEAIVVGAPSEASAATGVDGDQADDSAFQAGAAYLFQRLALLTPAMTQVIFYQQSSYIKASNTDAYDAFGWSVALSGNTLVVGAPEEDSAATGIDGDEADDSAYGAGAAYVFDRSGGRQQAYLKASNAGAFDGFGICVAISGGTLVVGASGEDSAATGVNGVETDDSVGGAGAAYVFVLTADQWTQQAYLKASNTEENDSFAGSLSLSGDGLVVGAIGEDGAATGVNGDEADDGASNAGAVYAFVRTGVVWAQRAYFKASNTGAADNFGQSVALSADTLVVGVPREDSSARGVNPGPLAEADDGALESGAAYVLR